jgi:predicted ATP-binding protein involved in virulence
LVRFYKQQPNVLEPKDLSGIVIIDELDLHLHPKWQRKLPILLSQVFPKVQFIVSTHSVIPFLGAPEKSLFFKVTRSLEEGIHVQRIGIDIKNLLPNSILTSPIFDLEGKDIIPEMNKSIHETRTENTYKEILDREKIRERLRALKAIDLDLPDDLFKSG